MNKNFEEEYQNMIESELPDLWDRIEAQLPDTTAAPRMKKISYRHMTAWIMAAAAVVCVCLLLPILSLTRRDNAASQSETKNDMEAECAEAECESGASEEGFMEGPMPEDPMPAGGEMADEAAAGNSVQSSVTTEAAEEELMTEDTVAEEMPVEAAPEENQSENVNAVLMAVEILDRITDNKGNTLYLAEILENPEEEADTGRYLYLRYAREGELEDYNIDVSSYESTLCELIPSEEYEIYLYETGEDIRECGIKTADEEQYKMNVYVIAGIPLYD